jgi:hypothetical protein
MKKFQYYAVIYIYIFIYLQRERGWREEREQYEMEQCRDLFICNEFFNKVNTLKYNESNNSLLFEILAHCVIPVILLVGRNY